VFPRFPRQSADGLGRGAGEKEGGERFRGVDEHVYEQSLVCTSQDKQSDRNSGCRRGRRAVMVNIAGGISRMENGEAKRGRDLGAAIIT